MMYLKRQERGGKGQPAATVPAGDLSVLFPATWEFMTASQWDDGKPRETGTMLLVAEHGCWKVWLHDRDSKRSCWLTGQQVEGAMQAVEKTLAEGLGEWRPDRK